MMLNPFSSLAKLAFFQVPEFFHSQKKCLTV